MLARFVSKSSNFRLLIPLSAKFQSPPRNPNFIPSRFLSTNHNNNNNNRNRTGDRSTFNSWKLSQEYDGNGDSIFDQGQEGGTLDGLADEAASNDDESWLNDSTGNAFEGIDREFETNKGGDGDWKTAEGYKAWTFDTEPEKYDIFNIEEKLKEAPAVGAETSIDSVASEELLEKEKQVLSAVLKGKFLILSTSSNV